MNIDDLKVTDMKIFLTWSCAYKEDLIDLVGSPLIFQLKFGVLLLIIIW